MKRSYRDLYIWQASVDLAIRVLALTDEIPLRRRFALVDQLTRASLSVPSNIAEGKGLSAKELRYFLGIARGSLFELKTQLEITARAGYADRETCDQLIDTAERIGAGINKLLRRLNSSIAQ